jgi:hypothetical protein
MFQPVECRPNAAMFFLLFLVSLTVTVVLVVLNIMVIREEGIAASGSPTIRLIVWIGTLSWILNLIVRLHASPRFTVTPEGINLHLIYREKLVKWEDIRAVEVSPIRTYIIVDSLSIPNLIAGILVFRFRPIVVFSETWSNYFLAMKLIRDQLGNRVKDTIL